MNAHPPICRVVEAEVLTGKALPTMRIRLHEGAEFHFEFTPEMATQIGVSFARIASLISDFGKDK